MPPRGVKKGTKRARQYEHIKDALEERGEPRAEEEESSRLSREDISSGRRGGLRSHRKGPRGRTRAQLYEEAKDLGVKGRSTMTKDQLRRAVARKRG